MDIDDLTRQVIGCSFKIQRALGSGFLERVYENSLRIELVWLLRADEAEIPRIQTQGFTSESTVADSVNSKR